MEQTEDSDFVPYPDPGGANSDDSVRSVDQEPASDDESMNS